MENEKLLISHHKSCADCLYIKACVRAYTIMNCPFEQKADICPLHTPRTDAVEVVHGR